MTEEQANLDGFFMPTKEECADGDYTPQILESDDYIVKIAKITLQQEATWNSALKKFDPTKTELGYKAICLAYRLKAEEGLFDTEGKEVKPLKTWIWRSINPFSLGFTKDGEPSFLRAFITHGTGQAPSTDKLKMPGVVILDKNSEIATNEDADKYKEDFMKIQKGEMASTESTMVKAGFKHIPDVRSLEGKYIGARVIVDGKGRNKITGFTKLPSTFVADASVETEAMEKFEEGYAKLMAKRTGGDESSASDTSSNPSDIIKPGEVEF